MEGGREGEREEERKEGPKNKRKKLKPVIDIHVGFFFFLAYL